LILPYSIPLDPGAAEAKKIDAPGFIFLQKKETHRF